MTIPSIPVKSLPELNGFDSLANLTIINGNAKNDSDGHLPWTLMGKTWDWKFRASYQEA